eukprot:9724225-Alexandrium_andersonii.AAC.1
MDSPMYPTQSSSPSGCSPLASSASKSLAYSSLSSWEVDFTLRGGSSPLLSAESLTDSSPSTGK